MAYGWHDLVGNAGVAVIVVSYLLMQLGRLEGAGVAYSLLNAAGASMVIVSLVYDFNMSAFVVEAFWVLISLVGAVRHLARRRESVESL